MLTKLWIAECLTDLPRWWIAVMSPCSTCRGITLQFIPTSTSPILRSALNAFVEHFNVFDCNLGQARICVSRKKKLDSNLVGLSALTCIVAMTYDCKPMCWQWDTLWVTLLISHQKMGCSTSVVSKLSSKAFSHVQGQMLSNVLCLLFYDYTAG